MNVRFTVPALLALLTSGTSLAAGPTTILNRRIQQSQTLAHALHTVPLPTPQVDALIGALSGVFDFKRVRPGDQLRLVFRDGELDLLGYRQSALDEWQVRREGDRFVGSKRSIEVEKRVATIELSERGFTYIQSMLGGTAMPIGSVVDPARQRAYVAISGGDRIAVIDTREWKVIDHWPAGREPDALGLVPNRSDR